MDLADTALVRAAGREEIRRVLTLGQQGLGVYRLPRRGYFTLLP